MSRLFRHSGGRPLLIGHQGLPLLAPANTLLSFELALAHGADSFEVDVVALNDGTLVAGHSLNLSELCHGAARGPAAGQTLAELRRLDPELASFDEVLELASARLGGRPFLIDLKHRGYEQSVAQAVRRHGLEGEALLCSLERRALEQLRQLAPEIARSLSYPADRFQASERKALAPFVPAVLRGLRLLLPLRIGSWLDRTGAVAVTLHHGVIGPALVRACHRREIAVIVWTVDDRKTRERLLAAGIDGMITNDPRPFSQPV